jgi:hypothetical protein
MRLSDISPQRLDIVVNMLTHQIDTSGCHRRIDFRSAAWC